MSYTPLPIGIDDFEEIIAKEYYYVDKTLLMKEILDKKGKVNLFTRPRRFGKTLNLSMLRYFFEKPVDGQSRKFLFKGLKLMKAGEKYTKEQGQYPVITLTLKSAKQPDWDMAYKSLVDDIAREFARHGYIGEGNRISEEDREKFLAIKGRCAEQIDYAKSLLFLSQCLWQYHQKKVIILIDEYDVPLENAYYAGFYDEMVFFIRSLFESALKTNPYLEFSVITGCLRISKESIFTGLNNLNMISILSEEYGEHFGFVEEEVKKMLAFYHREKQMDTMKSWYDGYRFGNAEVYNPWSVINFTEKLCANEEAFPSVAWSNSSSNSIIRELIYDSGSDVKEEIEFLMNGGTIEKKVHEDITYGDIHESEDNLWNFLFFTGYLKQVSKRMEEDDIYIELAIPNREVRSIYRDKIQHWFRDEVKKKDFSRMYEAMMAGNVEVFEEALAEELYKTISYMDAREAFYHGFFLGLVAGIQNYRIRSNRESGDGRYDVCIYTPNLKYAPVLVEFKVAERYKDLEKACDMALEQIEAKKYALEFADDGYTEIIFYGIGFYKKQLRVKMVRKKIGMNSGM